MSPAGHSEISDAQLVAYIDGELSAAEYEGMAKALSHSSEARERLEKLKLGGRPFGEAFDLLLERRARRQAAGDVRRSRRESRPALR